MDRDKTMEFLRGMKFMQRKEEARRREVLQHQSEAAIRQQVEGHRNEDEDESTSTSASSGAAKSRGPTIIMMQSIQSLSMVKGSGGGGPFRRKFSGTVHHVAPPAPEDVMEVMRHVQRDNDEYDADEQHVNGWVQDSSAAVTDHSGGPSNAQSSQPNVPSRRFVIPSSVRAPQVPKSLARAVDEQRRKRERDGDDDLMSDPRMQF